MSKINRQELLEEKKRLRHLYHLPENRKMNGKPTHEAFEKYGKRIYEIEHLLLLNTTPVKKEGKK